MKLLVYEHVSGGGYAGQPISPNVLSEGFGMLRSVAADFKAAGHEVNILLDCRISKMNPPIEADHIMPVFYSKEAEHFIFYASKMYDGVYIIAPETRQTLQSLTALVEQTGKVSLNCDARAIAEVADKSVLYAALKKNGLCTPNSVVLDVGVGLSEVKRVIKNKFSYPVILKPVDGVSCGGLSLVKKETQVAKAITKIISDALETRFIVQEFIEGEAASVSLISSGGKALAISLNKQNINLAGSEAISSYEGGVVPFGHPLKEEVFAIAEKTVESFDGLSGYVGVDLVLAKDKTFVVEVNPRLTTSYIGLRRVAEFNVAEAMINAVLNDRLPAKKPSNGFVYFSKIETSKPSLDNFEKAAQINGVVSPPFPLDNNDKACSLVIGQGESLDKAQLEFEEAKKRLLTIITGGT